MRLVDLKQYDFALPEYLLRLSGVEPRDSAKLFVYNTKTNEVTHDIFRNIGKYLPKESTLIFNETRVLPVRLWLQKESGGKIEVFVLINEWEKDPESIPVRVDRKIEIGQKLFGEEGVEFTVVSQEEGIFYLNLSDPEKRSLESILLSQGNTPIPPYLRKNSQTEEELRERYQTVFAQNESASAAAPTASLHFTDTLLNNLEQEGIKKASLNLAVGLGTFAPLTEENFIKQKLHTEYVTYSKEFLEQLQQSKNAIAVGTTSLRALETLAYKNIQDPGTYATDIFLTPGSNFYYTQGLITNFHTPQSSLLLLVDAFLQHKKAQRGILDLYEEAIRDGYSFYSFGDAMVIL